MQTCCECCGVLHEGIMKTDAVTDACCRLKDVKKHGHPRQSAIDLTYWWLINWCSHREQTKQPCTWLTGDLMIDAVTENRQQNNNLLSVSTLVHQVPFSGGVDLRICLPTLTQAERVRLYTVDIDNCKMESNIKCNNAINGLKCSRRSEAKLNGKKPTHCFMG